MTHRERWTAVFRHERPDTMAWFGDLTYWYDAHRQQGDLPERWQGPGGIDRLHRELDLGIYIPGCCAFETIEGDRVRQAVQTVRGVRTTTWETPVGSLRETAEHSPTSFSWGITEHAVKCVADLRVVRYIMEQRRYRSCPQEIVRIDREYGEDGVPVVAVPGSPLTELNKTWMGVIDMAYLLADEPAAVQETLAAIAASQDELYAITTACDCGYVMFCENLSAETMAGYYDEYLGPYLTRRVAQLHASGKQTLIHNDGTLRGTLEKLAATGMDCVDSVVPKPVGDVAVDELRALAGDDILLLGGLPGAMFAPPFAAREITHHVREIIRWHKDSGKFLFGVADQVPPNGDLALVKLVSDLVAAEGRY